MAFLFCDFSDDTDTESRTRKRLSVYEIIRNPQFESCLADLIFEEHSERLNYFFELNMIRKTADIMMRFNRSRFAETGFDHVRIYSTLNEIINLSDLFCFRFKYSYKFFTYYFAFLLRLSDTGKF